MDIKDRLGAIKDDSDEWSRGLHVMDTGMAKDEAELEEWIRGLEDKAAAYRATSIAFMAHAMEKRRGELISQPLGRIWEELATAAYDAEREGK